MNLMFHSQIASILSTQDNLVRMVYDIFTTSKWQYINVNGYKIQEKKTKQKCIDDINSLQKNITYKITFILETSRSHRFATLNLREKKKKKKKKIMQSLANQNKLCLAMVKQNTASFTRVAASPLMDVMKNGLSSKNGRTANDKKDSEQFL